MGWTAVHHDEHMATWIKWLGDSSKPTTDLLRKKMRWSTAVASGDLLITTITMTVSMITPTPPPFTTNTPSNTTNTNDKNNRSNRGQIETYRVCDPEAAWGTTATSVLLQPCIGQTLQRTPKDRGRGRGRDRGVCRGRGGGGKSPATQPCPIADTA